MQRIHSVLGLLRRNPDFSRLHLALLIAFAADWFAMVALTGGPVRSATGSGGHPTRPRMSPRTPRPSHRSDGAAALNRPPRQAGMSLRLKR